MDKHNYRNSRRLETSEGSMPGNEELQSSNDDLGISKQELLKLYDKLVAHNSELQTKVEESEETLRRYQLLAGHSRDIFLCVRRDDGRILEANAAAVNSYGYDIEELLGLTVKELRAPETIDLTAAQMAEADSHGILFETVHCRRDGSTFPVEVSSQGATIGGTRTLISVIRDITKRKHVEDELRASREKFSTMFQTVPIAMALATVPDGELHEVNPAWLELAGFANMEDVIGKTSLELGLIGDVAQRENILNEFRRHRSVRNLEQSIVSRAGVPRILLVNLDRVEIGGRNYILSAMADITERKRAEEALQRSEEQFRTLANAIPQLCWMANADGWIFWYNQRWYDYTGTSDEQMEGWGWQSVHDPAVLSDVVARWQASIATGEPFDMAFPLRGKDGVFRAFLTRVLPLKDASGQVLRWFGTNTDISDLKQAEAALRESERRYSALFANRINGMAHCRIITDEQGRPVDYRVLQINEAYERIIGIKKADIEGRRIREVFPDIGKYACDYIGLYGDIALGGGEIKFEEYFEATRQYLSIYAYSPLPGEFTAIFTDVTERKRAEDALRDSEALYRSLFGNMLNGFAYCHMIFQNGKPHDFVYLAVNAAFESLTGLKDVVGRKATEVIPGIRETDPQLLEIYGRVVRTGRPERFEIFMETMQMWFWISVYSTAPEHFVAVFDVITERKKAEQEIIGNQQKIREIAFELQMAEERERARIAGELHDRVGQGLLLGKMKLDMLESRAESEEVAQQVAGIVGLIEQSIQDIRSLTFQLRPPLLATAGLVQAVIWLGNELKDDYGLDIEVFDDQTPKPFQYEIRSVLYQAVRELLLNVVKHAGTKQARLALKCETDTLVITVEDKGIGFDPAEISMRKTKTGGYGLFNLQQRIEYLRGRFEYETAPGKGTRATIIFPLNNAR